jgi:hypothetical protein
VPVRFLRATALLPLLLAYPLAAQSTRPERTNFQETSSYADVRSFLDSLKHRSRELRVETLARSPRGRPVPYVVVSRPMVTTAAEARRSGKLVVYLQANIHGGEVEGKEAAQMLLREVATGDLIRLLNDLVLLVVPIYNIDGNERWGPGEKNRPGQNGPARVGVNPNGQGLNLNRDYVKMEAPETRAAAALIGAWDPELFIDLHTTNGSYHGYLLTYAPGLNPNVNPAVAFVRDRFLPEVRRRMEQRHRQRTFSYGNFRNQDPDSLAQGWETYDARPRFGTNWMGLRGRLSILSEGYSNASFRTRIDATYNFVQEVLQLAAQQKSVIQRLVRAADQSRPDTVAIRSRLASPMMRPVIAELTRDAGEGTGGYARRLRTGVYRAINMPVYDRFVSDRSEQRPAGYVIPARLNRIAALLRRQGIAVDRTTKPWRAQLGVFGIDSVRTDSLFEGHTPVQVTGQWTPVRADSLVAAGTFLVRTDQPLGTLAAYMLEPASEDGVVTWNFLDRELKAGSPYPITRVESITTVPVAAVP